MKLLQNYLIAVTLLSITINNISAQDYTALYEARLSTQDHVSSDGSKLVDVAAILRQDRANFHKFNKRDTDDQSDTFFSSAENRELIEKYFKNVYADNPLNKEDSRAILSGTPLVRVSLIDGIKNEKFLSVELLPEQAEAAASDTVQKLVGEWRLESRSYSENISFKEDGTYVSVIEYLRGPAAGTFTERSGTWKMDGDELVTTRNGNSSKAKIRILSATSFEEPSEDRNWPRIWNKAVPNNNVSSSKNKQVSQPVIGSPERKAIMDAMRGPVSKYAKKEIIFTGDVDVLGNWAKLSGHVNPKSGKFSEDLVDELEMDFLAILEKLDDSWELSYFGWSGDTSTLLEARKKLPNLPEAFGK